jgi:hypothetical protein
MVVRFVRETPPEKGDLGDPPPPRVHFAEDQKGRMDPTVARALLVLALALGGCGGATAPSEDLPNASEAGSSTGIAAPGRFALDVSVPQIAPFVLGPLRWQLTNAQGEVVTAGTLPAGSQIATGALAPAAGYTFTLRATDEVDAGLLCTDVAGPFTLPPADIVQVVAWLVCEVPVAESSQGCPCDYEPVSCPTLESLALTSDGGALGVGGRAVVTASGSGPDLPNLHFAWSITDPAVAHLAPGDAGDAGPTESNVTVVCDAPGAASVQVVVTDGPGVTCAPQLTPGTLGVTCAGALGP